MAVIKKIHKTSYWYLCPISLGMFWISSENGTFFVMRRIMPHYVTLFVIILLNVAWEIKYEVGLIWFLTAFPIKAAGSSEVIPFQSICLQEKEGFKTILYRQHYIGKLADFISIIIVSFFLPVYRIHSLRDMHRALNTSASLKTFP